MNIWIATTNKGKLIEFRTLLEPQGWTVKSPLDLPVYTAPPETGKTFVENARIKARTVKALKPGEWIIGEDSGLEVFGLNSMPGIHSARYAGPKASDGENIAKLLKMMSLRSAEKREARFLCTMVVFSPNGTESIFEGELRGAITRKMQGTGGFGYDPIFCPEGETKTLGELDPGFKNRMSHRARAVRAFLSSHSKTEAEKAP
jgi:XTP/dITP diphosphohydrolase